MYADAYNEGYTDAMYHPYDNPYTDGGNAELIAGYKDGFWDAIFRAPHRLREPARYRRWVQAGDSYGPLTK